MSSPESNRQQRIREVQSIDFDHVAARCRDLDRVFMDELVKRLTELGYADFPPSSTNILFSLDPEGTSLALLAERLEISKQAVSQMTKELVQRGYAELQANPKDGRSKLVRHTDKGLSFMEAIFRVKFHLQQELTEAIGTEAMAQLEINLITMTDYLK
ncbi:MAG: MarR family transcriptional regulator [Cyanobacteria bacterium J06635_15]